VIMRHAVSVVATVALVVLRCAGNQVTLTEEQMIRASECAKVTFLAGGEQRLYCISTKERLARLPKKEAINYIGSDTRYHFFFWYVKIRYYEDQTSRYALARSEWTPVHGEFAFDGTENRIGESLFPVSRK
jgi:hypothetical protein